MNKATRLFDCMELQAAAPVAGLLNAKENGVWTAYSTTQVHAMVNQLSVALLNLGISAGVSQ
jgi:long-chain acyl-CoA synthetase